MTFKPLKIFPAGLIATSLLLAGCKDKPGSDTPAKAVSAPVSIAAIAAEAKGMLRFGGFSGGLRH